MPTSTYHHPLFGDVTFKTHHSVWVRGDAIDFIDGFDTLDITEVYVPQLAHVPGSSQGHLRFHKRGHEQLKAVFADIEKMGLMGTVKSCAGSLNFRLRKPTNGALSKLPSNHAFGIAIDLNSDDGSLGGSIKPVAPIFQALGFRWGIEFADPMHFEVESFIQQPSSVAGLLPTEPEPETASWLGPVIGPRRVIAGPGLRIRAGAGTNFDVTGMLPFGATVIAMKTVGEWTLIDSNHDGGADGFVSSHFLV